MRPLDRSADATGKARVARNAIKHGFFIAPSRWTPEHSIAISRRPSSAFARTSGRKVHREEICVGLSPIPMCGWRRAALREHRGVRIPSAVRRDLDAQIATADATEAARLRHHREKLRLAGLWRPTIPGPREANAISRYEGRPHRAIRAATSELEGAEGPRGGDSPSRNCENKPTLLTRNRRVDFRGRRRPSHATGRGRASRSH